LGKKIIHKEATRKMEIKAFDKSNLGPAKNIGESFSQDKCLSKSK
jgi:hypothetical protein